MTIIFRSKGHDLRSQIQGQMTGNALKAEVTADWLEMCLNRFHVPFSCTTPIFRAIGHDIRGQIYVQGNRTVTWPLERSRHLTLKLTSKVMTY